MKTNAFLIAINTSILFSFSAFAFDWNIKAGDERLSGAQVKQMVFGKKITFNKNGGTEHYKTNGKYQFTYKHKPYPEVDYKIFEDGSRCMYFKNGKRRCDLYVKFNGELVLINTGGKRFKAKIK